MTDNDFYRFKADESLGKYALMRNAVQFLTDNYWKNIGNEALRTLEYEAAHVEENFHGSLKSAVERARIARERWPQDRALEKIEQILLDGLQRVSHEENLIIALLYGKNLERIHSNLGDIRARGLLDMARSLLDILLDTRASEVTGSIYRIYKNYHKHVGELVKIYDKKMKLFDDGLSFLSELQEKQASLLEELWLAGVMRGVDFNVIP